MFKELKTNRLVLKNIGYDDVDFMYKEFSTKEINEYLYDAEPVTSTDEASEWIDFYTQDEPRDHHRWIIVRNESNEKIGTCGFHSWDRSSNSVELGYDLAPEYWRKGYTSEALSEIIKFAKSEMNVKIIVAHIYKDNIASIKTAEKLGFYNTNKTYYEEFRGEKYLHYIYRLDL